MDLILLHLAVWASFASFALILVLPKDQVQLSVRAAIALAGLGAVASIGVLICVTVAKEPFVWKFAWLSSGSTVIDLGYYADRLSGVMLATVGIVSFFVQTFAVWYMKDDPEKKRFFSTIAFFTWAMAAFVVSSNLVGNYFFWELIGVASYLLVGFWHQKPEPRKAAIKAFVMTRFGDLGFLAAVVILLCKAPNTDIAVLIAPETIGGMSEGWRLAIVGGLFLGVMGKSAQFPLHTWLPDAMEGPTPVSALIHSATMVAAGVYLLVRLFPLVASSALGMDFIFAIGSITAVIAAMLALRERDMKRILAYSTVSQLGFMVMSIGAGNPEGSMFHLLTHAFFKSMLFLIAGYFIAISHHSNDIVDMAAIPRSQKAKLMLVGLWVGTLALSGLVPLSGFLSKESIFGYYAENHQYGAYAVALFVSFLTAYYSVRMALLVSRDGDGAKAHGHDHAHDEHADDGIRDGKLVPAQAIPIGFLCFMTVVGFWAFLPWLLSSLHVHLVLNGEFFVNFLITGSVVVLGILVAFKFFRRGDPKEGGWPARIPGLSHLLEQKFYLDAFWTWGVQRVLFPLTRASTWSEAKIINAAVNRIGAFAVRTGKQVAALQVGEVQRHILVSLLVIVAVVFYLAV